mmetsp:Transcript_43259/g.122532  ORF Transcript_43259/g.122532 Transcript_43259/m.122532 type:complete len:84 (-) Transcript_43259:1258-1509(-)
MRTRAAQSAMTRDEVMAKSNSTKCEICGMTNHTTGECWHLGIARDAVRANRAHRGRGRGGQGSSRGRGGQNGNGRGHGGGPNE